MLGDSHLKSVASRHGATPTQVALAWLLQQEGVVVIPKSGREAHVRENHAALELTLTHEDLTELDQAFPPPRKKMALEMR